MHAAATATLILSDNIRNVLRQELIDRAALDLVAGKASLSCTKLLHFNLLVASSVFSMEFMSGLCFLSIVLYRRQDLGDRVHYNF